MNFLNNLLVNLSKKKLGDDFEERLMHALEAKSCSQEDMIDEIFGHYQAIVELLCPQHSSIKLDADDLLTITIDNVEYDLDNKSSPIFRKAAEHRMAIEFLLSDYPNKEQIVTQTEAKLNPIQKSK